MLKQLALKNFTVFKDADFEFSKNLNVIIGENGTGKTHVLKAAYSGIASIASVTGTVGSRSKLQSTIADKLTGVFRPNSLGRLVRRAPGRLKSTVEYSFDPRQYDLKYSFSRLAKAEVSVSRSPSDTIRKLPVYLPTRELLTIFPGFVGLYDSTYLPFEETWRDACLLLSAPLARGPREKASRQLLRPLELAMGGKIEAEASGFYLNSSSGRMEMHLVAEGLRKLAMLARLIANGALMDKGYLFWDEPEANLNPKVIKTIAKIILELANTGGIQVFVATHSLFLLRELHILSQLGDFKTLENSYFGLHAQPNGTVKVKQGSTMDQIGDIAALDEELIQSDRYIESETERVTDSE